MLHNVIMSKGKIDTDRGQRIRYVRAEKLGLSSQGSLADLMKERTGEAVTRGAVGNWEQGKPIGIKHVSALAQISKTSIEWILHGHGDIDAFPPDQAGEHGRTVPVVGYVGAGAAAHYYAVSQSNLDQVTAPPDAAPSTVAMEVRGNSIGPLFNTWLVFYDEVRSPITPDLIGRLCVVGLPDDRILVKQIRRSARFKGLFDLISNSLDEEPIEGVEIAWAAKVKHMSPR